MRVKKTDTKTERPSAIAKWGETVRTQYGKKEVKGKNSVYFCSSSPIYTLGRKGGKQIII